MKKTTPVMMLCLISATTFGQGSLTPLGAPSPSMKTLQEVEPRTPISEAGYTIDTSGSYYLTTNLIASSYLSGITITADNVTVDLNGFSIMGSSTKASGIKMNDRNNVVVRNGTIRDCAYFGILAYRTSGCQFKNLRIIGNGRVSSSYDGINAGTNTTISGCFIKANGSGIEVDGESKIVENQILDNADDGLKLNGSNSYIADNIVKGNGDNYDLAAGNQLNILLCEIPENLNWPCSVRLAGTLICTTNGVNGITVAANDVSIDMDGHTLIGPGASSGSGIYQSSIYRNLAIKNGKVIHWEALQNAGIKAFGSSVILSDLHASTNYYGIYGVEVSVLSACTANDNHTGGISTGCGNTISDCAASYNGGDGVKVSTSSLVENSICHNNGYNGDGAGIHVLAWDNRIDGNNVISNDRGIEVDYSGNFIVRNSASRNSTNYVIHSGNDVGTIQTTPVGAGAWDNFEF
jgi:parallel beta-helix repeat protein